jgi:hypothetical protein
MTQNRLRFIAFPQTWLGRAAACLVSAALLVAAFFFAVIFLAIAGVLLAGFALRLLWLRHKIKGQATPDVIEGEYSVEQREPATAIPQHDQKP